MARVAGIDIPDGQRLDYSLRRIYGIGPVISKAVAAKAGIESNPRVHELTEDDLTKIREIIDHDYIVEGDLRRDIATNIKRLMDLGTNRGIRHRRHLPVRGQNTKNNARTRKGPVRPIRR